MTEDLNVRELLKRTYDEIAKRNKHRSIRFPKAYALIADDSDYHRTKEGYMGYETARQYQFNGRSWVIARGEACGSYPAKPFDSDILALEFLLDGREGEIQELWEKIDGSCYFKNSLIYGRRNGVLRLGTNLPEFSSNPFEKRMSGLLLPRIKEFAIVDSVPEEELKKMNATLEQGAPILYNVYGYRFQRINKVVYKPEFADFLADCIIEILNESSDSRTIERR